MMKIKGKLLSFLSGVGRSKPSVDNRKTKTP
jgi:hypothetical protein